MEIKINQDIRKFKTKDIGMFTFQQFIFVVVAVVLGVFVFYEMYTNFPDADLNLWLLPSALSMTPILLVGFGNFFGLSTKDFFETIIVENFVSPQMLKWENDFETCEKEN